MRHSLVFFCAFSKAIPSSKNNSQQEEIRNNARTSTRERIEGYIPVQTCWFRQECFDWTLLYVWVGHALSSYFFFLYSISFPFFKHSRLFRSWTLLDFAALRLSMASVLLACLVLLCGLVCRVTARALVSFWLLLKGIAPVRVIFWVIITNWSVRCFPLHYFLSAPFFSCFTFAQRTFSSFFSSVSSFRGNWTALFFLVRCSSTEYQHLPFPWGRKMKMRGCWEGILDFIYYCSYFLAHHGGNRTDLCYLSHRFPWIWSTFTLIDSH